MPGLFWCRWALQLGPVPAGKGSCPRDAAVPAAVPGSRGWQWWWWWGDAQRLRQGGSRARSNVSTSPSAAPEPGPACPRWERQWEWLGWRWGTMAGPIGAGSELSLCQGEGEDTRAFPVPRQWGRGSAEEKAAPLRRPRETLGTARVGEKGSCQPRAGQRPHGFPHHTSTVSWQQQTLPTQHQLETGRVGRWWDPWEGWS